MESMEQTQMPRFWTINQIAATGLLPAHCLREMVKAGTVPSRVIRAGCKVLINYDLLLQNLCRIDSEEGKVQ